MGPAISPDYAKQYHHHGYSEEQVYQRTAYLYHEAAYSPKHYKYYSNYIKCISHSRLLYRLLFYSIYFFLSHFRVLKVCP